MPYDVNRYMCFDNHPRCWNKPKCPQKKPKGTKNNNNNDNIKQQSVDGTNTGESKFSASKENHQCCT